MNIDWTKVIGAGVLAVAGALMEQFNGAGKTKELPRGDVRF